MKQTRLNLYLVDMKYIRNLSHADDHVMSVSPQIGKSNRPFVGIIVICGEKQYCIPLSSPKEKHKSMKNAIDFMKIYDDDKLIGVLNINAMIPVNQDVIFPLITRPSQNDSPADTHYKKMAKKQLAFCQKNHDSIVNRANRLYEMITSGKAGGLLAHRCCDFKKLEHILAQYSKHSQMI